MMCPLMKRAECKKENCAFYIKEDDDCAIKSIALSLKRSEDPTVY